MKPRLVFAGTPEFSVAALDALQSSDVDVVAAYCQPDRPSGRGRKQTACPVKQRALEHGIEVRQPLNFRAPEEVESLRALQPDLMVVVAYGLLLPASVLETPRLGCTNLHASLLPRWRGAAPIQRAIEAGDEKTGVTLMQMDPGLDTGDMLATVETPIYADDTSSTLHDRLSTLGARLLAENLSSLLDGELTPTPQDNEGAIYAKKIESTEARIDWGQSAAMIEQRMRAFDPWPGCRTTWNELELKLWRANAMETDNASATPGQILHTGADGIRVQCGDGVLNITSLQKPGARRLDCADFLNGVKLAAGDQLS